MGTVGVGFSVSLDGFIADPNDDVQRLFGWYFSGDTDVTVPMGEQEMALKMSSESARQYQEMLDSAGAIVAGRRLFDVSGAWGGKHPANVPVFVVTHNPPPEWDYDGSPFTFVTEGVESAIAKARAAAGDKNVGVGGADLTQQALRAGLVDEIQIDLVPVLLGDGVRLFDGVPQPVELEIVWVIDAPGVTHIRYRVLK